MNKDDRPIEKSLVASATRIHSGVGWAIDKDPASGETVLVEVFMGLWVDVSDLG